MAEVAEAEDPTALVEVLEEVRLHLCHVDQAGGKAVRLSEDAQALPWPKAVC